MVADFAIKTLAALPGKHEVWAVGERVHERFADAGLPLMGLFAVPNSVKAITPLVGQILLGAEAREQRGEVAELHLFHNCPKSGAVYEPVDQRLLPLDEEWRRKLAAAPWRRETCPGHRGRLCDLAGIHQWISFRVDLPGVRRIASGENASRLAAMQRADKNIDELLEDLNRTFHRLRQNGIDEELFDVVSGFEALTPKGSR